MTRFAIIGHCGYIAPRHLEAINNVNGALLACFDIQKKVSFDNLKQLPTQYTNYNSFLEFIKLSNTNSKNSIDYVSICSPNHMHFQHIKDVLSLGCNVICEKPLVGSLNELQELKSLELLHGKKVYSILQLRYHQGILALKDYIALSKSKEFDIDLIYIAGRDKKYLESWKGDATKSFGIGANIGIHFFDMLYFAFGDYNQSKLSYFDGIRASGYIKFKSAKAKWFLSISSDDIPNGIQGTTYRKITVNDYEVDFSNLKGFKDLHTISYEEILNDRGFGIIDAEHSLKIALSIEKSNIEMLEEELTHPFLRR